MYPSTHSRTSIPTKTEEGGIALFLQGYQVVLGVKGARADPRVLRQTLDASAATWTWPPQC